MTMPKSARLAGTRTSLGIGFLQGPKPLEGQAPAFATNFHSFSFIFL